MKAPRLAALLGAVLFTAGELFALDYGTAWLVARHSNHAPVAALVARR